MTVSEYASIEERFKNDTLGKMIDYDGEHPGECWDSAEVYFTQYLGVPASVLAGCELVSNMLYPPKLNELLEYFDEVSTNQMIKGDTIIYEYGHICVFDHFDGQCCWFVTQNNPVQHLTTLSILDNSNARAFRLKGIQPDKKIKIRGHIQNIGWTNWQDNVCGTTGEGLRLEAFQIDAPEYKIKVKAHIEGIGWVDYGEINKDTVIGTTGESKRLEAIQIIADGLEYQVHIQDLGWSSVVPSTDKYSLGTTGFSKRIEAICIK